MRHVDFLSESYKSIGYNYRDNLAIVSSVVMMNFLAYALILF